MECQLCGQDFPNLNKAKVEDSIIDVCDKCLKFGTEIVESKPVYKSIGRKIEFKELIDSGLAIADGYGYKIKKAREIKGMTREQFANIMNEKESVIKRIEEEHMEPTEKLAKRIENFLGIGLKEKYEERKMRREEKKSKLTVGDIVKVD
jgi:putative transcription factor